MTELARVDGTECPTIAAANGSRYVRIRSFRGLLNGRRLHNACCNSFGFRG